MVLSAQLETIWRILGVCSLQRKISWVLQTRRSLRQQFSTSVETFEWKFPPNLQVRFLNWNVILDLRLNSKNCGLLLSEMTSFWKCICTDDLQIGKVTLPFAAELYQILMNNCFQSKTAESKNLTFKENTLSSCYGGHHDILGITRISWC